MCRWYERYREFGYDGLYDRRLGRPSPKRVPVETLAESNISACPASIGHTPSLVELPFEWLEGDESMKTKSL
jgi:hypothetical protein